jgi:hypothetical protein
LEIDGFTPEKYARNVARYIYLGNEMNKLVLKDDGKAPKQFVTAGRSAIPNLIKNCIKTRFILELLISEAAANKAFLIHVTKIRERVFFFSMIVRRPNYFRPHCFSINYKS